MKMLEAHLTVALSVWGALPLRFYSGYHFLDPANRRIGCSLRSLYFFFFAVLEMQRRASPMLGKCSTPELHITVGLQKLIPWILHFQTLTINADCKGAINQPLPP